MAWIYIDWRVSIMHSCIHGLMFLSKVPYAWNFILFSIYILLDLIANHKTLRTDMIYHHVLTLAGIIYTIYVGMPHIGYYSLIYFEASTPSLHAYVHLIRKNTNVSKIYKEFAFYSMVFVYFICRVIGSLYIFNETIRLQNGSYQHLIGATLYAGVVALQCGWFLAVLLWLRPPELKIKKNAHVTTMR